MADFVVPGIWGLILLMSWVGWGWPVRAALGLSSRAAGWGLMAGWGMAVVLAMGGFLQLAGVCNALALSWIVWIGLGLFLFRVATHVLHRRPVLLPPRLMLPLLPAGIALAVIYLLSLKAPFLNNWDDYPAYLVYAKNLLQNGIIDQPYSLRRLLTFGGQQQLDAMLLLHASIRNIDILELGLCRILFVAIVAGIVRPRGTKQRVLSGLFLAGLAFVPREHLPSENTHSEMTGLVLFLTLLQTLSMARGQRALWRFAAVAAMVGAAVSSMRVSYLPAAVLSITFYYLGRIFLDRRRWASHATNLLVAAVVFGVILLPWSLVLYHTSGTLMYPPWPGTLRPEYTFLAAGLTLMQKIGWVVGFAFSLMQTDRTPLGLVMCWPLLLAFYRRHWRTELPFATAAVVTAAMTLWVFTQGWYDTMYRYIFPIMFGITIVLVYRALLRPVSQKQWWIAAVTAAFLALAHVPLGIWWLAMERPHVPEWRISLEQVEAMAPEYQAAQESIPPNTHVFVAASLPTHFDFQRNKILIADIPGAASPSPGMPLLDGPAAVKKYLKAQGIDYVIYSDDNIQNMYNREYWDKIRKKTGDNTPDIENVSRFYFAFLAILDEWGRTQKVLYRNQTLVVVELN